MKREYGLLLTGIILLSGVILWIGMQRADFELTEKAIPPGSKTLTIRLKAPVTDPQKVSFALDPEVPVVGLRRLGEDALLLLLGSPLEAGMRYTLRAKGELSGSVRIQVEPLRMRFLPAVFRGPSNEPALLLTGNAPLPASEVSLHDEKGKPVPVQAVVLSEREALYLLKAPVSMIEVPFTQNRAWILEDRQLAVNLPPFQLRESIADEHNGRLYVRLRFSHWIEGRLQNAAQYITISEGIPFTIEAKGIDLYLYPEARPAGAFTVEVRKGFPGMGEALPETQRLILSPPGKSRFAWHQPYVHFVAQGTPLLFHANPSSIIELQVWRILPQNLRFFFRQKAEHLWMNYTSASNWWDYGWGGWWSSSELETYGELVRQGKLPVSMLKSVKRSSETLYAIGGDLPPGIYAIEVQNDWETIRNWLVVSSYGLIARRGVDGVHVWAVRYHSREPLSGVQVELWGAAGQLLLRGTTDRQGHAFLPYKGSIEPEGIYASWASEVTYLPLRGLRPGRWAFETGGLDPQASGLMLHFIAPRTLYRPGETMQVAGVLRTPHLQYPRHLSRVWGRLRGPLGQVVWSGSISCGSDGTWSWSYTLPLTAVTGDYGLEILTTAEGELIGILSLQVEAFRPNRLDIQLRGALTDAEIRLTAQVSYLYGAPGSGLVGEAEARWKPLAPPGEENYIWIPRIPEEKCRVWLPLTLQTNARGEAQARLAIPQGYAYGEVRIQASFTDDEGRPNRAYTAIPCMTQPYLVGIRKLPSYVRGGHTLVVPLRILRAADLKAPTEAVAVRAEVIEKQYEPLLIETPWGSFRQEYRPVERLFYRGIVELQKGEGAFTFTPQRGEYEIRIWAPQQAFPTIYTVEAWDWGEENFLLSDPEGGIEIRPQKPICQVGEKARFLLKLPMEGSVLLTVEREKVFYTQWINPRGDAVEVEVPIRADYLPGIYIHAMALHGEGAPFRVSRGLLYLPVQDPATRIQVQVEAPERVLPGSSLTVQVKSNAPKARLILAGVDVGALPLQRNDAKDPHDFFYQKRAYTVQVSEQFPYAAPWSARIVGGGEESSSESAPPEESLQLERAEKVVSFFWHELRTDQDGKASVQVQVPAFTGRLRWRAFLLEEKRFGMGEAFTTVAAPVVGRVSLPLAMSEGDETELTLLLQNTTHTSQSGQWRIDVKGEGLHFSAQEGNFRLAAGAKLSRTLRLRAVAPFGKVLVRLSVQGQPMQEKEVLLRPPAGIQREVQVHILQPGEQISISDPSGDWIRWRSRLVGGSLPAIEYTGALWNLIHFPHGCAEQITSQAFVSLTAGPWLEKLVGLSPDTQKAHVRETLRRLASYQTTDGGFGYWHGSIADPWLSVYVMHFLLEAKQAGYTEAEPLYERSLTRERQLLASSPLESRTQAYRALLLARALGTKVRSAFPSIADVNTIKDPVIRALWRAAFAQVGLPLPEAPSALPIGGRQHADELISPIRELALFLYAESFLPVTQRSPLVEVARKQLLKEIRLLSTHEASWLILALRQMEAYTPSQAEVRRGAASRIHTGELWAEPSQSGELTVLNKGQSPLYVAYIVEGIPARPAAPLSRGFQLRTEVHSERTEALIAGGQARWIVSVEVAPEVPLPLTNVALTLPIPAGWIVEGLRQSDEKKELPIHGATLVHIDQRDDRLHLYITLQERRSRLELPIRVILAGRYQLPSLSLTAMYEPTLYATTAAQVVRVEALPQ